MDRDPEARPFARGGPQQNPEVLDYLKYEGDGHYDVLEVEIIPKRLRVKWSAGQLLSHVLEYAPAIGAHGQWLQPSRR